MSPLAWRRQDLEGDRSWQSDLDAEAAAEFLALCREGSAGRRWSGVRLPALVEQWRRQLTEGRGIVTVHGFPVDQVDSGSVADGFRGMCRLLGSEVAQNRAGDLLVDVRDLLHAPDLEGPDRQGRAYHTNGPLKFHVDGGEVVALLCLQPAAAGGRSMIVSSVAVYNEVLRRRPDLVGLLFEPWYFHRFEPGSGEPGYYCGPMASWKGSRLSLVFLRWYIDKAQEQPDVPRLSAGQRELLDLIDDLTGDPDLQYSTVFFRGDLQILSNQSLWHARTDYADHPDPRRRRHLLRLWLDLTAGPAS